MQLQVGVDDGSVVNLAAELKEATERWGASFLTAPLAHQRHRRDARGSCIDSWSTQWVQQVVGKLSAWVVPRLDCASEARCWWAKQLWLHHCRQDGRGQRTYLGWDSRKRDAHGHLRRCHRP